MLRTVQPSDVDAIVEIYNHYIVHSPATFEEQPIDAASMALRIGGVRHEDLPWLVAEDEGRVVGYAYATRWKERSAYRFSVEATVYLAPDVRAAGWGTRLCLELFERLRAQGVHVVIGGVTLPNSGSRALLEKLGMRKVAHFSEVGFKHGQWWDVGYWQTVFGTPGDTD